MIFQSKTYVRAIKIFFVTLHHRNLRAFLARNGIEKLKICVKKQGVRECNLQ